MAHVNRVRGSAPSTRPNPDEPIDTKKLVERLVEGDAIISAMSKDDPKRERYESAWIKLLREYEAAVTGKSSG